MANFSVATNFDPELLIGIGQLNNQYSNQVVEVYGSLPTGIVGSGRAGRELPNITPDDLQDHIALAHDSGLKFSYLLNANAGIRLEEVDYVGSVRKEIGLLLDAGVDSLTISDDSLIDLVRGEFPEMEVHLSVINGVSTVQKVKEYADKGIKVITLNQHIVNRDLQVIEDLVRSAAGVELRLYANISCLDHCPLRNQHYQYISSQSQSKSVSLPARPNPYLLGCALEYLNNPIEFLKSPFIRPEDINAYEQLGLQTFKLSDRREPTPALIRLMQAYLSEEFHGNLFALLFREGRKWTSSFTVAGLQDVPLPDIFIDNDELGRMQFLERIKSLQGDELDQFYREATLRTVKGISSPQTKTFERFISKYI